MAAISRIPYPLPEALDEEAGLCLQGVPRINVLRMLSHSGSLLAGYGVFGRRGGMAQMKSWNLHPKRFGRPHEYASLALQIVENDYINAATLRIDGGARA